QRPRSAVVAPGEGEGPSPTRHGEKASPVAARLGEREQASDSVGEERPGRASAMGPSEATPRAGGGFAAPLKHGKCVGAARPRGKPCGLHTAYRPGILQQRIESARRVILEGKSRAHFRRAGHLDRKSTRLNSSHV